MTERTPPSVPLTPDDAAVESEWRRIERERIAEEVEEAREDAIAEGPSRRRWPWLAFAAALAAGAVAALILNSPAAISRRTVAVPPEPAAADPAEPTRAVPDEPPAAPAGPSEESLDE